MSVETAAESGCDSTVLRLEDGEFRLPSVLVSGVVECAHSIGLLADGHSQCLPTVAEGQTTPGVIFALHLARRYLQVPLIVLVTVAVATGLVAWRLSRAAQRRWSSRPLNVALAREVSELTPMRRWVRSRLAAEAVTGLTLTLALGAVVGGGVVVGTLAALVRTSEPLADLDSAVARWAEAHASSVSDRGLELVSSLVSTPGIIAIALAVGVIELIRLPSRWLPPFLLVVIVGDSVVTNVIKQLMHRARPTLEPVAATLGPSFPSGHSSTAAALFAGLALIASRGRSARIRSVLIGVAVGLAVAVACSRVLLDVHWVSDVVAGLVLGWAWFAACAAAFGGGLLRFGAPVEVATTRPSGSPASPASRS